MQKKKLCKFKIQMKIQFKNIINQIFLYKNLKFNSRKMIQNQQINASQQQQKMIKQQERSLFKLKQQQDHKNILTYKNVSIWNEANYKPTKNVQNNKHNFNIYADKLLIHLVLQVKFDFQKISQIMSYTFKQQQNLYTQQTCRQRWYQIHRDRHLKPQIKAKQMENKRVKSIMSMTDPFILYNVDEKLHKMQKQQKQQIPQTRQISFKHQGYNIFKNSIRKIDDLQRYHELQKTMRQALSRASKQIQLEKPMLYTPYYDRLQQFQVQQQELTVQKMQQMMSHPIQLQLMERQLKVLDLNQRNFESKIKKDAQKKVKKQKIQRQEQFQIQQDWDQYQSD